MNLISRKSKMPIIILCLDMLGGLLTILFLVPHQSVDASLDWLNSEQKVSYDVTLNDTVYSKVVSETITKDLPRGSYDLTVVIEGVSDNDIMQVQGLIEVSSIYSNSVSCALSQYGTEYTISFENYHDGNSISLNYYSVSEETDFSIQRINIQSTSLMPIQFIFIYLILMLCLNILAIMWKHLGKKKWAFLIIITIFASLPLFTCAIYYGHDTLFHLTRIEGLKAGLLSGQFPVRISAEQYNGYGYLSSAIYPELLLYFPAALRLLNIPIIVTYSIFWFIINLTTAYISWISFSHLTHKQNGGYIGCMLFTLLPYRLISIYLRGAFGEALALTFFPLILWGVYEIFYGDRNKWPVAVLGYTGVLQCHILTTATVIIVSVIWGLFNLKIILKEKKRISSLCLLICSFLFLNLWFLVPFLMLYRLPLWVKYSTGDFLEHLLYPYQLFEIILRGFGNSLALSEGTAGEMPFSIGLGLMIGLAAIVICFVRRKFSSKSSRITCLVCLGIAIFFYWTTTTLFPWDILNQAIPALTAFSSNLPWRRLGIAGLFLTAAVVIAVTQYTGRQQMICASLIATGILISSGSYLLSYINLNDTLITTNTDYGNGAEDELYLYFATDTAALKSRGNQISISSDTVEISQYKKYYTNIELLYINPGQNEEWIDLPLNYYPGYVAYDNNGNSLAVLEGENHYLRIILPSESSSFIKISYINCNLYRFSTITSCIYLVLFVFYLMHRHYITSTKHKHFFVRNHS